VVSLTREVTKYALAKLIVDPHSENRCFEREVGGLSRHSLNRDFLITAQVHLQFIMVKKGW
jgi:hypothetical protein